MENIKPNKQYKIITVQLAVSADEKEFNYDKIGNMFNQAVFDGEVGIDDWQYGVHWEDAKTIQASNKPKEGELFK